MAAFERPSRRGDPFGGPLWVTVDGESRALGDQLVSKVHGTVEERAQR